MKKIIMFMIVAIILCSCSRNDQINQSNQTDQSNQIDQINQRNHIEQFDQNAWFNEPENREDMLSSLTNNYQLNGMTEEEITVLLGKPDQIITEQSTTYLYFISYGKFVGINASLLQLKFDENGKIESHSVVHK